MIVKLCGMRHPDNIRGAESLGVDWMGFIFHPHSPRCVDEVPAYLPHRCLRVGVFVNASVEQVTSRVSHFGLQMLQLHGAESPSTCADLRQRFGLPLIKALPADAWQQAPLYENVVDYLLFDTPCAEGGGSGHTFDWQTLEHYDGQTPFLLSGGIGLNTMERLKTFHHPRWIGVDLNSCFELQPGYKDLSLLEIFLEYYNEL